MSERTSYPAGVPSWIDLASPDTDASAAFYGGLFGWDATEPGPVEETGGYRTFLLRGQQVAGLVGVMNEQQPPVWSTYVATDDADATAARVAESGGTVLLPPMDVMDLGRLAVFADPAGAVFGVWQARQHTGAALVNEPGALVWNELATRDLAGARTFYEGVFGWTGVPSEEAVGHGYTEWRLGDSPVGGMLELSDQFPPDVPANWLVYFATEDVEATMATAVELGGSVLMGPIAVPIGTFAVLADPHGAAFAAIALAEPAP